MVMTPAAARSALTTLGWPTAVPLGIALGHFQRGLAGRSLPITGRLDTATSSALLAALARLQHGEHTASEHFSFTEFACKCKYADCERIWVQRSLITKLEVLRARHYPGGLAPLSGCRCKRYNADLYRRLGKPVVDSQHIRGAACDLNPRVNVAQARAAGFTGIGYSASTLLVTHVDIRPIAVKAFIDGK